MSQNQNAVEQRPVFMPRVNSDNLVKTDMVCFERGGPFTDLLDAPSRQAKKTSATSTAHWYRFETLKASIRYLKVILVSPIMDISCSK